MYKIAFTPIALFGYMSFQKDKKMCEKINTLLKDIARNPESGLGKPERLKGDLNGYYSRRIDLKHRIIYKIEETSCEIIQVGGHYKDR
ncbi:Txe/YoeB family addiction module toxin [Helicobacter mesocricetorum]|uniref:Txe/YoeB family addiction module toxin n=1 Tax=Helicobacter mesocricetorum TaxID=87012 RepID=UPI000CF106FD|nr:Txe/YoeB family addiction module toxin [Helicobacter mesocricetorum]